MAKKEPNDKSHEKGQELLKRLEDNLNQIEIDKEIIHFVVIAEYLA